MGPGALFIACSPCVRYTAGGGGAGAHDSEVTMKISLLVVALTGAVVLFGTGSTLALMNNACKTGAHSWCVQSSEFQHHAKTSPS